MYVYMYLYVYVDSSRHIRKRKHSTNCFLADNCICIHVHTYTSIYIRCEMVTAPPKYSRRTHVSRTCVYLYISTNVCQCMYTYLYTRRESEKTGEKERERDSYTCTRTCAHVCTHSQAHSCCTQWQGTSGYANCNKLQHTVTHCTLQFTATHCNSLHYIVKHIGSAGRAQCGDSSGKQHKVPCNSLQSTAPHCNTLHLTATHCNSLQHTVPGHCETCIVL